MKNETYDVLKNVAQVWIPAVSTLCASVMALFHVDAEVIAITTGCLAAVDTFLGAVLGVSTSAYNKTKED